MGFRKVPDLARPAVGLARVLVNEEDRRALALDLVVELDPIFRTSLGHVLILPA